MNTFWNTWPKYVKTLEHHGVNIYLAATKEDFCQIMLATARRWHSTNDFGEPSWFTTDTYSEYFVKKVGMTEDFFNTHILPVADANIALRDLVRFAKNLNEYYVREVEAGSNLAYITNLCNSTEPTGFANTLYDILSEVELDRKLRFVVNDFDKI